MKGWIIFILVLFATFAIIFSLLVFESRIPRENLIILNLMKENLLMETFYKNLKASLLISTQKAFQKIEVKYDGTKRYIKDVKELIEENLLNYIKNIPKNGYDLLCNNYIQTGIIDHMKAYTCNIKVKKYDEDVETDNITIKKYFEVSGITEKEIPISIEKNFSLKVRPEITFKQIDNKVDSVINELNNLDYETCSYMKSKYGFMIRSCSQGCPSRDYIISDVNSKYSNQLSDKLKKLSDENFFINSTPLGIKNIDFYYQVTPVYRTVCYTCNCREINGTWSCETCCYQVCDHYECRVSNIRLEHDKLINIEGRGVLIKPFVKFYDTHVKSC